MLENFLTEKLIAGVVPDTIAWYRCYLTPWLALEGPPDLRLRLRAHLDRYRRGATQKTAWAAIKIYETWKARLDKQYPWVLDLPRMRFAPAPIYDTLTEPELWSIADRLEQIAFAAPRPIVEFSARRDRALYIVLYYTAQRLGGIRELRRAAIDWKECRADVVTKGRVSGSICLPPQAVDALKGWMKHLPSHSQWIFPSGVRDAPIAESWVSHRLPLIAAAVKIHKRVWVHGLRHSGITEMGERGVSIEVVSGQALHRSLTTTKGYMKVSRSRAGREIAHAWGIKSVQAGADKPSGGSRNEMPRL